MLVVGRGGVNWYRDVIRQGTSRADYSLRLINELIKARNKEGKEALKRRERKGAKGEEGNKGGGEGMTTRRL